MSQSDPAEIAAGMKELARAAGGLHAAACGKVLSGRWKLIRKLGEGGYGSVYEAEHLILRGPVAIKVLQVEHAQDAALLARFIREAQAAAMIRHPHIVEVRDFGREQDGRPYLVMELMLGRTLRDVLVEDGALPADRVRRYMAQAASALVAAHEADCIHRDLKPDNFMLTSDERGVKISDFGLCIFSASHVRLTGEGKVYGSVQYFAPERIRGEDPTAQSDVYSFGAMLFELLTGRPLWADEVNPGRICQHHLHERPPRISSIVRQPVPDDLVELTELCLAKNAEDRPTMQTVAATLAGRGSATTAPLPSAPTAAAPLRPRLKPKDPASGPTAVTTQVDLSSTVLEPPTARAWIGAGLLAVSGLALLAIAVSIIS